jgi:hypothetical protein
MHFHSHILPPLVGVSLRGCKWGIFSPRGEFNGHFSIPVGGSGERNVLRIPVPVPRRGARLSSSSCMFNRPKEAQNRIEAQTHDKHINYFPK